MNFLNSKFAKLLTAILVVETISFFWLVRRAESVPTIPPLSEFPATVGSWILAKDLPVDKEVEAVLKADDTLSRAYAGPSGQSAYLFVAYFKTQRTGQAPHSPKNCLPGAGWEQLESNIIPVDVATLPQPIRINHYVVEKGSQRTVTLYWYESRDRIIASEFAAKFWLVADSIRYHRSDTALVKVEVAVNDNNFDAATRTGVSFIQTVFPLLRHRLPQ